MALYRKYRPGSFAELVGQEQVTKPLSTALDSGRINHAYLFSGPRGCGKTSSARILARSLNCVNGPTSTPCGVCPSCVALAPNGPGSLDVTELDAASYNGVEDMRELRDRAAYAPAESRYRIFIIDEAHMITTAGANALLKVVEEPPAHLIFIFATTEPEKVIPTIRSRVHHYPFRLLTPGAMRQVIDNAIRGEGIPVEESVYPLVIRAGNGSPRDTLSVLDQLLAGAGPDGLTYDLTRLLLGITDDAYLDAAVAALSAQDGATLFQVVDDLIESGVEAIRFANDLLDRLRDLLVLQTVPQALDMGLVDVPADRGGVLMEQAATFAPGALAHVATTLSDGRRDLKGATSPRLLLEILCTKMLLSTSQPAPAQPASFVPTAPGQGIGASAPKDSSPAPQPPAKYERKSVRLAREKAERERAAQEAAQQSHQPAATPKPAPGATLTNESHANPQAAPSQPVQSHTASPAPAAPASAAPAPSHPAPQRDQNDPANQKPNQAATAEQTQVQPPAAAAKEHVVSAAFARPEQEGAHVASPDVDQMPQPAASSVRPGAETADEGTFDVIVEAWSRLQAAVQKADLAAGILLSEARPLGMREGTLILGHNTGALAASLNAPEHNKTVTKTLNAESGREFQVHCVIGTDPVAAGFSVPEQPAVWNPRHVPSAARESTGETPQEPERPAKQPAQAQPSGQPAIAQLAAAQPAAAQPAAGEPERSGHPAPPDGQGSNAQPSSVEQAAARAVGNPIPGSAQQEQQIPQTQARQEPPQQAPAYPRTYVEDGWGEPAPIGQALPKPKPPRVEPPKPQNTDAIWGEPAPIGQQLRSSVDTNPVQQESPATASVDLPSAAAVQPVQEQQTEGGGVRPFQEQPVDLPQAEPSVAQQDEPPRRRWQEAAERGAASLAKKALEPTFADGAPLPPEPEWDEPPAPDPYGYPPDEGIPAPVPPMPREAEMGAYESASAPVVTAQAAPVEAPDPQVTAEPEVAENLNPQPSAPASPEGDKPAVTRMERFRQLQAEAAEAAKHAPEKSMEPEQDGDRQSEEEEMMAAAAAEPGKHDHRDAMSVAIDLLAQELGARRL